MGWSNNRGQSEKGANPDLSSVYLVKKFARSKQYVPVLSVYRQNNIDLSNNYCSDN